jgi:hypothetical protein
LSASDRDQVFVTRFIRKLRGGSQPILAQASDGFTYVVKLAGNPQGKNIFFNEAMGSELYRAVCLPVPDWKPLNVNERFLDRNPQCWFEVAEGGSLRPEPGLCFGSRYLGREGVELWEILPGSSFRRVLNGEDFQLAWLVDICASHADNRQAVFEVQPGSIRAFFVDHGHMFAGPDGIQRKPKYGISAYLDKRIYAHYPVDCRSAAILAENLVNLNVDKLWRIVEQLPIEWLSDAALRNFASFRDVIADTEKVLGVAEWVASFPGEKDPCECLEDDRQRGIPDWLLRAGVQA